MMSGWFVSRNGQRLGPYTFVELQRQVAAGTVAAHDGVWPEGGTQWVPAASVPGLAPRHGVAAPPAAASPPTGAAPRPPSGGLKLHVGRALAWNLRTVTVRPDEEATLLQLGVDDPAARAYLAWRRSVLLVIMLASGITAAVGLVAALIDDHQRMSDVGIALDVFGAAMLVVMPLAAWRAAATWTRHARSRRILVWGWTVSFLVPLLLALVPVSWRYDLGGDGLPSEAGVALQLLGAIANYVTLMPTVLALIPGIMRACLRVKILLPQSMLPGWFLVAASPLWIFLFLVMFAIVDQVASEALLVAGVVLLAGAPVIYLFRIALFTRPVADDAELGKLLGVQRAVRLVLGVGLAMVVAWLCVGTVFGRHIIGLEPESSFVRPWDPDMFRLPLEFMSHSLFTMALVADLVMAMNLAIWQHTKAFVGTSAAHHYDRTMSEIDEVGRA
jgi:uncharacterized protein DUF4339